MARYLPLHFFNLNPIHFLMKKLMLALLAAAMPFVSFAQDSTSTNTRRKEIGLTFYGLDGGYGLTYRTGTNKALWRFNSVGIYGQNSKLSTKTADAKTVSSNASFSIGREYRKPIASNIQLRYGIDVVSGYNRSLSENTSQSISSNPSKIIEIKKRTVFNVGLRWVMGINYDINEKIAIGAELLPTFSYGMGKEKTISDNPFYKTTIEADISEFNYSLSTSSILFSIVYRLK